jgi:hypothetical protein
MTENGILGLFTTPSNFYFPISPLGGIFDKFQHPELGKKYMPF